MSHVFYFRYSRNAHTNKVNISTVSEYCLIREILFMFRAPTNCKFFRIVNDSVEVNDSVSLNSVSLVGLLFNLLVTFPKKRSLPQPVIQSFLKEFCQPMTLVHRLHTFCRTVKQAVNKCAPHTYQCFAEGIQQCMEPFQRFILAKERRVNELDQLVHPVTIANLFHELREHFETITHLYQIYQNVTLDFNKYSGRGGGGRMHTDLSDIVNR